MKPIYLAFSGSGFKVAAHCGGYTAALNEGFTPAGFAGTSGGSIVAALAAVGMSPAACSALALHTNWAPMLTFSAWSLATQMGYCSGTVLLNWLLEHTRGRKFADLDMPLTIMATDMQTMQPFEFSQTKTPDIEIAVAARASAAIPLVFAPVRIGDSWLWDGGMVNDIPIDMFPADDTPRLGINLTTATKPMAPGFHTILDMVPRAIQTMMEGCDSAHIAAAKLEGAKLAFVDTSYADGLDRNMPIEIRQRLFDDGYKAVKIVLEKTAQ